MKGTDKKNLLQALCVTYSRQNYSRLVLLKMSYQWRANSLFAQYIWSRRGSGTLTSGLPVTGELLPVDFSHIMNSIGEECTSSPIGAAALPCRERGESI